MSKKSTHGLKACIKCKFLVSKEEKICPSCNGKEFSEEWSGLLIIFNVEKSEIAKILNIKKEGMYAIKVK